MILGFLKQKVTNGKEEVPIGDFLLCFVTTISFVI